MAPSLEELCSALQTNRYLVSVLALCHRVQDSGFGSVDCGDGDVAGVDGVVGTLNDALRELLHFIDTVSETEKLSVVPFLCRLGYSVVVWLDEDAPSPYAPAPFSVHFPHLSFRLSSEKRLLARSNCVYYRSTSPGAQRLRGVVWCLPRVMRWKWRAIERGYAPGGPLYLLAKQSFERLASLQ